MRIGVFSVIFQQLPFEQALDKILSYGAAAVEIGTGGLPGAHHCPIDELLASNEKRRAYLKAVEERGMIISAFSCHWDPIGPDKAVARASDELFRKTVRLAEVCGVPAINLMSGVPAGSAQTHPELGHLPRSAAFHPDPGLPVEHGSHPLLERGFQVC
jgi:sugar phosphate isomerase/epimerase